MVTFGIFSLQSLLLRQGDFKIDFDFDNFDFFGIKYFDSYQKLLFKYVLTKKSLRRKDTSNFGEIFRIRLFGLCISCSFCLLSTSSWMFSLIWLRFLFMWFEKTKNQLFLVALRDSCFGCNWNFFRKGRAGRLKSK